jgi:hypothetical protein
MLRRLFLATVLMCVPVAALGAPRNEASNPAQMYLIAPNAAPVLVSTFRSWSSCTASIQNVVVKGAGDPPQAPAAIITVVCVPTRE